MKVKVVPWWRKALDFALNGIRSGFGLFSRTQKQADEIEPEIVTGHEEIREEEAELTDHSPERELPVEVLSHVDVTGTAEADIAGTAEADVVDILEAEASTAAEVAIQAEPDAGPEQVEDAPLELAAASDVPVVGHINGRVGDSSAAEPVETAIAVLEEPIADSETATEELQSEAETEPAVHMELSADGKEERDAIKVREPEIETGYSIIELEPEPAAKDDTTAPETEMTVEQMTGQQVTEVALTVDNGFVDELAPQADAAIGLASRPKAASPVPDEIVEQEIAQVAVEPNQELVVEFVEFVVDQGDGQIIEQTAEHNAETVQAIVEPMELNHSNSEPVELEQAAEIAAPTAAEEEAVAAPDADVSQAADEAAEPAPVSAAQYPSKPFIKLEAREGDANASAFSVIVSRVYDGPLDLLLDLIRKQDIDIYDIPIARITAQFLAYVNQLKASDVDVAGEFIYTASLLIHIKSKMLLPRAPAGPDDAAEDPRRELVERLLEHERFKNAAQMLQQKQMLEAASWTNPGVREFKEDAGAEPEIAADTVDLVRVFRDILDRARNRPVLDVQEDAVTVGQMIQFLSRRLTMEDKPIALRRLLSHTRSERALIAMFLALLELVRLQAILLRQDRAFSEIFIKKHSNFESVLNEGATHDEWK